MAARIEYLLTSEDIIKSCTNISDNLSGKYLQGAIREAQETALRDVLGSCLLDALKARLAEGHGTLPDGWYKELADRCQYFLAFFVSSRISTTYHNWRNLITWLPFEFKILKI